MKSKCPFFTALASAAAVLSLAASGQAGIFTWSAPTVISTADTTLNQSGTIIGAEVFGYNEKIVVLGDGTTIDFKADNSVAAVTGGSSPNLAYGAFTTDTGNAAFNKTLTQFNFDNGPKTITLNNLVPGQQYAVQLFALDQRSGTPSSRQANFQDPSDGTDVSATFLMGSGDYVIGTFTATATTASIQENLLNAGGGDMNALVVRAIGTNLPPQITSQPQPATLDQNLTATFTAAAVGTAPLSYQWQKSTAGGSLFANLVNGGTVFGATSNVLTITHLSAINMADYQVVVSSSYGSVTSSPAATLNVSVTPQFVWTAPAPITTADATLNLSGTIVGAEVFGVTSTLVTLTNGATVYFDASGSSASLTAGGYGTDTGAFTSDTGNANFNAVLSQFTWDGGPDVITLNNLISGQQYSVQLFSIDDRTDIVGDGSQPFRTANFQDPNDADDISAPFEMGDNVYTLATFTASGSTASIQENMPDDTDGGVNDGNINAVVIRALGVNVAPQIVTPPSPVTIDQGLTTSLSVVASGTAPLTYRWQKSNVGGTLFTNVVNGGRISGTTNATLTITNLQTSDTGDYQIIVANAVGSVTSTPPATLTVQAVTPQFLWSFPTAISRADATLSQSGTIIGAEAFGPTPAIVVLTNGTSVDFKADGSVATTTGLGTATGAFSGSTGNAAFDGILTQFNWDGGPKTITLNNLVAGQQYAVQLFGLDDRSGTPGARHANFQDPADPYDYSSVFVMANNVYTIATFTASGTSVSIQENLPDSGGGNINALVVRQLSGQPIAPQITTEPQSVGAVPSGRTVQFVVGAIGTSLNYQWQRATVGGSSFNNVSDANASGVSTAQLTITNATSANTADYRVIVSNASGSVTSSPAATLDVASAAVTLLHRWSFNETSGTTAHDSIGGADGTLMGSAAFTGSGYVNLPNPGSTPQTGNSYVSIPGGLLNSLSAVTIECWVTNNGWNNGNTLIGFSGPIDENGFGVNYINFYTRMYSSISAFEIDTTSGDSGLEALGTRVNDNGVASGVPSHYVYIYDPTITQTITLYTNGVLAGTQSGVSIPLSSVGTTVGTIGLSVYNQSQSYVLPQNGGNKDNDCYLNGGISEVRIYSGLMSGSQVTDAQNLGPDQLPTAPQITSEPQSASVSPGGTVQLTVGATGLPLNYQWQRATVGGSSFSNVSDANASGVNTAQLTITNATSANIADYRVLISNGSGSVTSSPAATLRLVSAPAMLLHRWSFNETSGTIAHDSVGGANGALMGSASFTGSGYVNLPNPGSSPQTGNSYVSIPGGLLNSLSAVTIECWVTNNGWNNGNTLVGFSGPIDGNGFGTNYIDFFTRMYSTISAFQIDTVSGNSGLASLGSRVNDNGVATGIPSHYVYIYDPSVSQSITLYTNGVLAGTQSGISIPLNSLGTAVGTIGLSVYNQSQAYTLTNNGGSKANCPYINGGIDEVRIYSGVMSTNTVVADYQLGPDQLPPAALIHRWSFNETSGTIVHDSIGGANGTLMGGASFNGGYAVLPNTGSATDNSYVSIPGGLLNSLSAVTVECWVTNNGWANGNTFVGFGGQWNSSGIGTNFIDFFARWYNAMSAFQIQTTVGDSGIVGLGTRVNYNSIVSPSSPAHYVYTYNPAAGTVTLYTNGVFSGSASGVTIPLSTLGTNVGTIGLAVWNTNFAASIPNTSGNRPFMNAGISEVRLYNSILSSTAVAADFQLGPDLLPPPPSTTTNKPTVNVVSGPGTLTLSWPSTSGSFYVESSPVPGPNAVWTLVPASQSVVGPNYQMTLPTTGKATMFFRLHQ